MQYHNVYVPLAIPLVTYMNLRRDTGEDTKDSFILFLSYTTRRKRNCQCHVYIGSVKIFVIHNTQHIPWWRVCHKIDTGRIQTHQCGTDKLMTTAQSMWQARMSDTYEQVVINPLTPLNNPLQSAITSSESLRLFVPLRCFESWVWLHLGLSGLWKAK